MEDSNPTPAETRDLERLNAFVDLAKCLKTHPVGDVLTSAIEVFDGIETPWCRELAEKAMRSIRAAASRAEPTDKIFENPPRAPREFTDGELIQLLLISRAIHELCYCSERIQEVTEITWGGSTPTGFYLDSMYHMVSSLFLIDAGKPTHKSLPMGGTAIRALHPMGLSSLLVPVKEALEEPFGQVTLGQAILRLRNKFLVHGDFSLSRVEDLIQQNQMRNPVQQARWAELVWRLFHRLVVLDLALLSLLGPTEQEMAQVMVRYLQQQANSTK